jgi:hypothetical protein
VDTFNFDLDAFLVRHQATIVFTEEIESGVSIYAYSKSVKYRKQIKGKIVNLQIFIPKEKQNKDITIGTPIIFGSF